jgi:hypothetical protein
MSTEWYSCTSFSPDLVVEICVATIAKGPFALQIVPDSSRISGWQCIASNISFDFADFFPSVTAIHSRVIFHVYCNTSYEFWAGFSLQLGILHPTCTVQKLESGAG